MSSKWYAVTYRGTAEMVVWVQSDSPENARSAAENGDYEEASAVEFVKGKTYTMKVKLAPNHVPGNEP